MPLTNAEGVTRENMDGLGCDWCGRQPEPEVCQSASGAEWTWDQLVADRGERVCQPCRRGYDERVAEATRQLPLTIMQPRYRGSGRMDYSYGLCQCAGRVAGHPVHDHYAASYDYLGR